MVIHDFAATHRLLPYAALADEVRVVLLDKKAGIATAPQRLSVPLSNDGILLTMPAADRDIAITKLVTVHPHNAARGLPSINGEVIVMRAGTGERLLLLDGKAVTMRRTAAISLLAAKTLASEIAQHGPMLIVGAGAEGKAHLEAFAEWLPCCDVFVYSRTNAHAQALAQHGQSLGIQAHAVEAMHTLVSRASIIITCTTSTAPLFKDDVRDGAMVIAVGAYSHAMCELPHDLVHRSRIVVDTLEGAQHEAGDLSQAGVDWARVEALEDVIARTQYPERSAVSQDQMESKDASQKVPIVFKSVGHALWDLAAARLAVKTATD